MAWNEPGGGNKNPWEGRGGDRGPPDLDDIVRKMQEKLGGLFGGRPKRSGGAGPGRFGGRGIGVIAGIVLLVWLLSGFYIVDAGWRGVETRFGRYVRITMPGPNWHFPYPIETVDEVNVGQSRVTEVGYETMPRKVKTIDQEALMLTQDENIVNVKLAVQYQVKDAPNYLFSTLDPDVTLKQVTESALREAIGKSTMDFVLTEGRAEVAAATQKLLQAVLDNYNTGLQVTTVNLQDAQPPEQVQGSFEDAIKAREDEQRLINEAEAYSNEIVPKARGAAARRLQEAQAYRAEVIAQAEGEANRFEKLLAEYKKAPEVTRERLYLVAVEKVLSNARVVMLDVKGGSNLVYLPLDRIMQRAEMDQTPRGANPQPSPGSASPDVSLRNREASPDVSLHNRDENRSREVR
jgi:HflK protein